jgi:hypothetical protein
MLVLARVVRRIVQECLVEVPHMSPEDHGLRSRVAELLEGDQKSTIVQEVQEVELAPVGPPEDERSHWRHGVDVLVVPAGALIDRPPAGDVAADHLKVPPPGKPMKPPDQDSQELQGLVEAIRDARLQNRYPDMADGFDQVTRSFSAVRRQPHQIPGLAYEIQRIIVGDDGLARLDQGIQPGDLARVFRAAWTCHYTLAGIRATPPWRVWWGRFQAEALGAQQVQGVSPWSSAKLSSLSRYLDAILVLLEQRFRHGVDFRGIETADFVTQGDRQTLRWIQNLKAPKPTHRCPEELQSVRVVTAKIRDNLRRYAPW